MSTITLLNGTDYINASYQNINSNFINLNTDKEDLVNKSTSIITDQTSDIKYPSVKSVKTYADQTPDYYKYQITTSVSSGNLTVSLLNYLGNTPSADAPVKIQIGGVVRSVTSALSLTQNAGNNYLNAGSAELATKEIDFFTYLCFDTTGSALRIGWARCGHFTRVGDFDPNGLNEKGCLLSLSAVVASDQLVNIGRLNAILSAGGAYTWSLPTTSLIINQPTYETRWLSWTPVWQGGAFTITNGYITPEYKIVGSTLYSSMQDNFSNTGGTLSDTLAYSNPFTVKQVPCFGTLFIGGTQQFGNFDSRYDPSLIRNQKSSNYTAGQSGVVRLGGFSKIA